MVQFGFGLSNSSVSFGSVCFAESSSSVHSVWVGFDSHLYYTCVVHLRIAEMVYYVQDVYAYNQCDNYYNYVHQITCSVDIIFLLFIFSLKRDLGDAALYFHQIFII